MEINKKVNIEENIKVPYRIGISKITVKIV